MSDYQLLRSILLRGVSLLVVNRLYVYSDKLLYSYAFSNMFSGNDSSQLQGKPLYFTGLTKRVARERTGLPFSLQERMLLHV
jgi:hypothetical protein